MLIVYILDEQLSPSRLFFPSFEEGQLGLHPRMSHGSDAIDELLYDLLIHCRQRRLAVIGGFQLVALCHEQADDLGSESRQAANQLCSTFMRLHVFRNKNNLPAKHHDIVHLIPQSRTRPNQLRIPLGFIPDRGILHPPPNHPRIPCKAFAFRIVRQLAHSLDPPIHVFPEQWPQCHLLPLQESVQWGARARFG